MKLYLRKCSLHSCLPANLQSMMQQPFPLRHAADGQEQKDMPDIDAYLE